jgi:hypothetical protein
MIISNTWLEAFEKNSIKKKKKHKHTHTKLETERDNKP